MHTIHMFCREKETIVDFGITDIYRFLKHTPSKDLMDIHDGIEHQIAFDISLLDLVERGEIDVYDEETDEIIEPKEEIEYLTDMIKDNTMICYRIKNELNLINMGNQETF